MPTKLQGRVSPEVLEAHQQAIAAAQDQLLTELLGTKHTVTGRFKNVPGLGLEVGPDALAVLERSDRVANVSEELLLDLGLAESGPLVEADQDEVPKEDVVFYLTNISLD